MKKSTVFTLHLVYWMVYLLIMFILFQTTQQGHEGFVFPGWVFVNVFASSALVPAFISFYSFYSFLFDRFLTKKRTLALVLVGFLVVVGSAIVEDIYLSIVPGPGIFNAQWESAIGITVVLSMMALVHGLLAFGLKGFITWFGDIKLKEELNKKNFETELALVKSQINPHFLFNTINNIDVLIGIDAAKASSYLNKLSDIMRFMLYETKTEEILLSKELIYLEKYIDLQKIRSSHPNYVNFVVSGKAGDIKIAPMLLISFIENAFKHAEANKKEDAIKINLVIEKGKIVFECANSFVEGDLTKNEQSGLGNELIQKRLNLLYPNNHKLDVTVKNNQYKIKLNIDGLD